MSDRCAIDKGGHHLYLGCDGPVRDGDKSGHETGYCSPECYEDSAFAIDAYDSGSNG